VARWLLERGFKRVSVLVGGLRAWRDAGYAVESVAGEAPLGSSEAADLLSSPAGSAALLPSLAERYLRGGDLPVRRRLASLFADIVGSTRLLAHESPEAVLSVVQRFQRTVTEVAIAFCGDVKGFEGDGTLLYFESAREAAEAALAIREALRKGNEGAAHPFEARQSLNIGEVVLGMVGTALRQAVELVGPSLNVGNRLLKQAEPGGVIATGEFVEALRAEGSDLAGAFELLSSSFPVPDAGGITVATYHLPPW
jgi:class 3 adenylate cyclase